MSASPVSTLSAREPIGNALRALAVRAPENLAGTGVPVRAAFMPSSTVFGHQPEGDRSSAFPDRLSRVAVGAGNTAFWWKYVHADGAMLRVDRLGGSAPAADVYRHFGLPVENPVATA